MRFTRLVACWGIWLLAVLPCTAAQAQPVAASPVVAASGIPYRPVSADPLPGAGSWLTAALACLVLLAALVWLLRSFGNLSRPQGGAPASWPRWAGKLAASTASNAPQARIVERLPLTHHTQLLVVEVVQRRLVLAVGPQHTVCLRDEACTSNDTPASPTA